MFVASKVCRLSGLLAYPAFLFQMFVILMCMAPTYVSVSPLPLTVYAVRVSLGSVYVEVVTRKALQI